MALAAVILAACLLVIAVDAAKRGIAFGRSVATKIELLSSSSLDERKLISYGDRTKSGYGYVREVLSGIPNPKLAPLIRYERELPAIRSLLPGNRWREDRRLMIGIDVGSRALYEPSILQAGRTRSDRDGIQGRETWTIRVINNYDYLTGVQLHFDPASSVPTRLKLRLLDDEIRRTPLGEWQAVFDPLVTGSPWTISFPELLRPFSRSFFAIEIEKSPRDGLQLFTINPMGVRIDLAGYTVLHRSQGCFTAMRTQALESIRSAGPPGAGWRKWIESLASAGARPIVVPAEAPCYPILGALFALLLLPSLAGAWLCPGFCGWSARWWVGLGLLSVALSLAHAAEVSALAAAALLGAICLAGALVASLRYLRARRLAEAAQSSMSRAGQVWIYFIVLAPLWLGACALISASPVSIWDALTLWHPKVKAILEWRSLQETPHPNYPVLGPAYQALIWFFSGDEGYGRWLFPTAYLIWGASLYAFGDYLSWAPSLAIIPLAMLFGLETTYVTSGYQDCLVMACSGMAALYLCCGSLERPRRETLLLAAFFCGLLGFIKTEGAVMAFILIVSSALVYSMSGALCSARSRIFPEFRLSLLLAAGMLAAWPIVLLLKGMDPLDVQSGSFSLGDLVHPAHVSDRWPLIQSSFVAIGSQNSVLLLSSCAVSLTAFAMVPRCRRAISLLWIAAVLHLLFTISIYLLTRQDLFWHLYTSAERVARQASSLYLLMLILGTAMLLDELHRWHAGPRLQGGRER